MSKEPKDEKSENLLVSVVRKVIKEEHCDSSTGSRLTTKTGSKDIVKAANDFASKVGSGKAVDKDIIHRTKGKRNSFNKKHRRSKARAREIPRVIPKEKEESPHKQTKQMERVQKKW